MLRKQWLVAVSAASIVTSVAVASHADNPIVQTNYTADPAPLVHDGSVYVYTTHDEDSATDWFTMNEWRVYSSKDMVNWTDHGSPLHYTDFSWARGDAWAGHVAHRNGKFYFYVPITSSALGRMTIGVAYPIVRSAPSWMRSEGRSSRQTAVASIRPCSSTATARRIRIGATPSSVTSSWMRT